MVALEVEAREAVVMVAAAAEDLAAVAETEMEAEEKVAEEPEVVRTC